jgi:hypothetical protein
VISRAREKSRIPSRRGVFNLLCKWGPEVTV